MSTNEPPVDPTANPVGWRPPTEPSGESAGSGTPPVWTPPGSHGTPSTSGWVDPTSPAGYDSTGSAGYGSTTPAGYGANTPAGYGSNSPASYASGPASGDPAGTTGGLEPDSEGAGATGAAGPAAGETPASASGWAPGAAATAGTAAAGAAAGGVGYPSPPGPPPYVPPPTAVSPGPRKRPGVVVGAAAILLALAICSLGHSVLGLVSMGSTVDRFKDRARVIGASGSDIDAAVSQMRVSYIFGALFAILFAVVLAGLAYGLLKGSNGARIATWIISGIAILCDCCSTLFYFGANGINITTSGGPNDLQTQLAQAQLEAFPAWFLATGGGISLLQLLGYIAVAVLLALPAANAFFRKVAPGWLPPTP